MLISQEMIIFLERTFPYVYDKNFLKERAKIIQKLDSTDLSNFLFSNYDNELKIKFAKESLPIKIKSVCSNQLENLNDFWINKSALIKWNNKCKELIIETVNKKQKKIKIFDNPVLNTNLPLNFKDFISIEDLIPGKKINNNFYPSETDILIGQNVKVPENLNLILSNNQKIFLKNSSTIVFLGDVKIYGLKKISQ